MQQNTALRHDAMTKTGNNSGHVCPWWVAHTFDNPLRRLVQPADRVLGPYVRPGMTTLDYGCGLGHFSIGMARLVGDEGRVLAVDVQQKMLNTVMSRARKAGLDHIIEPIRCDPAGTQLPGPVDFAVAANVLHELPDLQNALAVIHAALRPGALLYVMEPRFHVGAKRFEAEVAVATGVGFTEKERPDPLRGRGVLLQRATKEEKA